MTLHGKGLKKLFRTFSYESRHVYGWYKKNFIPQFIQKGKTQALTEPLTPDMSALTHTFMYMFVFVKVMDLFGLGLIKNGLFSDIL